MHAKPTAPPLQNQQRRLNADFYRPVLGEMLLIVIDTYFKWIEALSSSL